MSNKVVVITGGARGIGLMMAEGFVRNGSKVYITSRKAQACDETAARLTLLGPGTCTALAQDLMTENGCKSFVDRFSQHEKICHVLINNSGIVWNEPLETYPDEAWDRLYALNVKTPFYLTRLLLPHLDAAAKGSPSTGARIINIGSIAGITPQPMATYAYDVTKAGVHHLTRVLASKLSRRDNGGFITVNCIAPGFVPSKMTESLPSELVSAGIPMQRSGQASDLAGIALFLASKAASWITGAIIPVDGGVTNAKCIQLTASSDNIMV